MSAMLQSPSAYVESDLNGNHTLLKNSRNGASSSPKGVKVKKATKRRSLSLDSQSGELSDELSNDEDDDSIDDDFEDDDDDETEEDAPSHIPSPKKNLKVNGKGKTVNSRGTGPVNGNFLAVPVTPSNKRRFSNLSTASVLDEDDGDIVTPLNFPRKKKHRTLSNNNEGLLAYSALRQRSEASEMVSEVAVESDDDDDALYQAVNLISDDEDDADVEKLEEEVIMSTEPSFGSFGGDPFLADPSSEMIYMMGPPGYFGTPDRELARLVDFPVGETERPAPKAEGTEGRKYSNGSTKRVRFWDEQSVDDDSSSTSSDLDAIFPDIFAEQDRLPPLLQKLIDNDTDIDNGQRSDSDGEHSYWDFSETDQASPSRGGFIDEDVGDDADDSTSSGYDSEGETTDEDLPPPATIRSAKTLLHRSPSSESDKAASPKKPFRRTVRRSNKISGPRWGHFTVDPKKATAYSDTTGAKVIVHPPRIVDGNNRFFPDSNNSSAANSPRMSLLATPGEESDYAELTPHSITNPRDIMFGGIFGMPQDVGNLLKGSVIGPPEAFFPFVALDGNGNPVDEVDEYSEDEDDSDDDVDLNSFLALPDGADEDDDIFDTPSQPHPESDFISDCPESTPVARTRSAGERMLEHFDRTPGVVSSFRSNQDKYRNIASQHPNPDLRASNQAVRFGKSAETPITPLRKRSSAARRAAHGDSPLLRHSSARRLGPKMGTFT